MSEKSVLTKKRKKKLIYVYVYVWVCDLCFCFVVVISSCKIDFFFLKKKIKIGSNWGHGFRLGPEVVGWGPQGPNGVGLGFKTKSICQTGQVQVTGEDPWVG